MPNGNIGYLNLQLHVMKKSLVAPFISSAALLCSTGVSAQALQPSPYASEACNTGCANFEREAIVYSGALVRTYRVCANNWNINVIVDGRRVPISSNYCADVSGQTIRIDGPSARAGLLPN